jgi:hypothetical protein
LLLGRFVTNMSAHEPVSTLWPSQVDNTTKELIERIAKLEKRVNLIMDILDRMGELK